MEIQLYVYDLTHGMARNMSRQLLGIQIDAVYHTAIVFDGIEYFFGAGVQQTYAGATHHGRPMEIISLGTCSLPKDVIMEYLESLKTIYTPESYDLFAHNCNNFSNDFATFLVGKGIPDHITGLPKQVLDTPFGQMLRPQIDASMRGITQAPVPAQAIPSTSVPASAPQQAATKGRYGNVVSVKSSEILQKHIAEAKDTCVTIFFTSATCPPCKLVYGPYDILAQEHPQALFLKIDLDEAREIASAWSVRATPSFVTFALGEKMDEWAGADPRALNANVERALNKAFPPHPHATVEASKLQYGSLKPTTYAKVPPLDKLTAKLGGNASDASVVALRTFIEKRQKDVREATLPDLASVGKAYRDVLIKLPVEVRFAAIDLLRCAMIDQRVSGYFAEEQGFSTIAAMLKSTNALGNACPHNLRLVTIHLLCNCFTSPLFIKQASATGRELLASIIQLITEALLDNDHLTTRVATTSLTFNLCAGNYRIRREENREGVADDQQAELAAALIQSLSVEANEEAVKGLLLSLGYLVYFTPADGEVMDLCRALEAKTTVQQVKHHPALAQEVAKLL